MICTEYHQPERLRCLVFTEVHYIDGRSNGSSIGKEYACKARDQGSVLGWEVPLEKEMATVLPGESHGQSSLVVIIHGVAKSRT